MELHAVHKAMIIMMMIMLMMMMMMMMMIDGNYGDEYMMTGICAPMTVE